MRGRFVVATSRSWVSILGRIAANWLHVAGFQCLSFTLSMAQAGVLSRYKLPTKSARSKDRDAGACGLRGLCEQRMELA
jgi:hypothetical protein